MGDPSANLLVLLVYLQGAAVIFRLGRHHHRGPELNQRKRISVHLRSVQRPHPTLNHTECAADAHTFFHRPLGGI